MNSALRDRRRRAAGVDQADESRRHSDWGAALEGYRAYLRRNPRDHGVRMRLLKTLYAAGHLEEAEILLGEVRRARPGKAELSELAAIIGAASSKAVSIEDYNLFRRGLVIPNPPALDAVAGCTEIPTVIIDARGRSPRMIGLTRANLRLCGIATEPRVLRSQKSNLIRRFFEQARTSAGPVLMLDAGVTLDPQAPGWLMHALQTTGAAAAYGDDDCVDGPTKTAVWSDPAFHPAPHPLDMATTPRAPAAVLFRSWPTSNHVAGSSGAEHRRALLMDAFDIGCAAHVPLLLATTCGPIAPIAPIAPEPLAAADARILVIIPTRDEGVVLKAMIESLEATAVRPSQFEIVVVDNGSRNPATVRLLQMLSKAGRVRVLLVDEPFNWSKLNSLAAAGSDADVLLFANNDMQMITEGWDDSLRLSLFQPGVAVVGARLVYPNGLLQHGGLVLGALDGRPVHEGLGVARHEGGPLGRWRRNRAAAAVTGAFMGVRRDVFEDVGGFNAVEFAVGCNDIDFCLRVRERGWSVVYAADLELIHQESHSRGHDDTAERLLRAQGELENLFRIWGADAARDPGRNPHWVNHETLLYHGVRQPAVDQVEAWIGRSTDFWRVLKRQA